MDASFERFQGLAIEGLNANGRTVLLDTTTSDSAALQFRKRASKEVDVANVVA